MNSIYQIKPWFQRQLQPLVTGLNNMGVSPNSVTLFAVFISAAFAWVLTLHNDWIIALPLILLFRMMLNAIDGMLAKQFQKQSTLGEILNELGDIVSDVVLFIPLGAIFHFSSWPALIFLLMIIINEFCGVLAKAITGTRSYEGPMGKSDRALVLSLAAIALYCFPHWINYSFYLIYFLLLTIIWGTWNRLRFIIQNQKQ